MPVGAVDGGAFPVVKFVSRIAYVARIGGGAAFASVGAFFGNAFVRVQSIARRATETAVRIASGAVFDRAFAAFARGAVFERAAFAHAQNASVPFGVKEITRFALQTAVAVFAPFAIGQTGNAEVVFQIGTRLADNRFAKRSVGFKPRVASQTAVGRSALSASRGTRHAVVSVQIRSRRADDGFAFAVVDFKSRLALCAD